MFSVLFKREAQKTVAFALLDIVMVFLFTSLWFKLTKQKQPVIQSIGYTIYITLIFAVYYFLFDLFWNKWFKT